LNIVRAIAKNTLVLMVGRIITIGLTYFYTIYTARYLGAQGFGILSFAIAFTGIICLLADLGLSVLTTREISRNNLLAGRYIGNILAIKTILAIFTFGFTVIVINLLGYPSKTILVVYMITFSTIFSSFSDVFNSIFQAFQKMEYISFGVILNSVLMFIGIVIAISQNQDLIIVASIYLFASLIIFLYSLCICIWKFLIPKIELDFSFWKKLLKDSIPFWMSSVFIILYFRIDMIMLSMMKGDAAVGWYSASYRLIDGLSLIPSVFMSVMFPVFSKYYIYSKNSLEVAFIKSLKFITIIAIPIGIGITILSNEIIMFIFGNEYAPSVPALKIIIWASVFSFINFTPATLLNSTNKHKVLMIFTFVGAILNITLNFFLIPSFSYLGAGIATVITEFIVGLLMISFIQKTHNFLIPFLNTAFRSLVSSLLMGIFILIFKSYSLLLLIPISSVIYFVSLLIVKGIKKDEFNSLSRALGDKNG